MAKENLTELDKMAIMAHQEKVSYGKIQQRETSIMLKMQEQERIRKHQLEILKGYK